MAVDTSHTARPLRSLAATSPSTRRVMVIGWARTVRRLVVSKYSPVPVNTVVTLVSVGVRSARGSTYRASIGASTSRKTPTPNRTSDNGEAVRRMGALPGSEDGFSTVRVCTARDRMRPLDGVSMTLAD